MDCAPQPAGRATPPIARARRRRRDFANGFLLAEVLARYYPSDIEMHSFENVASTELKRANWAVLCKLFKVRRRAPACTARA